MARKRKNLEDLDYNSKEYWDHLLTEDGLSMERGRSDQLSYVGDGEELASIEGVQREAHGRIMPKPTDGHQ